MAQLISISNLKMKKMHSIMVLVMAVDFNIKKFLNEENIFDYIWLSLFPQEFTCVYII